MISDQLQRRRLLVPLWRTLPVTLAAKELSVPRTVEKSDLYHPLSVDMTKKLVEWRTLPGVITGGELITAAVVESQEHEAIDAARYISAPKSNATDSLKNLADIVLERARTDGVVRRRDGLEDEGADKAAWRRRTRIGPRNALAWVELSLREVIQGETSRARKAMAVALQLAPTNRHVLRSPCRLYLHLGEVDRAHNSVSRGEVTRRDPWLIAAQISVAELAGISPRHVRVGRSLLKDAGLLPRQTSELAGALGTLEMAGGRARRAREYFRDSLRDPTGSALAQASRAVEELGEELVSARRIMRTIEADEARMFQLLREQKFDEIPDVCERWARSEPYASRPYEAASSATSILADYERTLELSTAGLKRRRNAVVLLNNYAFAQIHRGELDKGLAALRMVGTSDERQSLVAEANLGLLEMRRGNSEAGLRHYQGAIAGFRRMGNVKAANIARIYRAREAALAGTVGGATLVAKGRVAFNELNMVAYEHVMRDAEDAMAG